MATGYSAQVDGFLIVGGERYRIAKSNHLFVHLAEPAAKDIPGGRAVLEITIDGNVDSQPVAIGYTIAGHTVVEYTRLPEWM